MVHPGTLNLKLRLGSGGLGSKRIIVRALMIRIGRARKNSIYVFLIGATATIHPMLRSKHDTAAQKIITEMPQHGYRKPYLNPKPGTPNPQSHKDQEDVV